MLTFVFFQAIIVFCLFAIKINLKLCYIQNLLTYSHNSYKQQQQKCRRAVVLLIKKNITLTTTKQII